MANPEQWHSPRHQVEADNRDRLKYFDKFIDMALAGEVEMEVAIETYKLTLEHQGIPLSPEPK